jgi:translation initiation factor 2B subunit (eIF-2B alpha/beta/delta family)
MSSHRDALIRLARRVVQQMQQKLNEQMRRLEDEVKHPIRAIVEQVTAGVWIGKGADAFVDEVTSLLIPGLDISHQRLDRCHNNIDRSVDIMDRADENVRRLAEAMADQFAKIYAG